MEAGPIEAVEAGGGKPGEAWAPPTVTLRHRTNDCSVLTSVI